MATKYRKVRFCPACENYFRTVVSPSVLPYCSHKCKAQQEKTLTKVCANESCKKTFKTNIEHQKFCSLLCKQANDRDVFRATIERVTVHCSCGESFVRDGRRSKCVCGKRYEKDGTETKPRRKVNDWY